jgi:hypothetical protein
LNREPGNFGSDLAVKRITFLRQAKPGGRSGKWQIETGAKSRGAGPSQGAIHNYDINLAVHREKRAPCANDPCADNE